MSEVLSTENEPYYHKNIKVINNEFESDVPLLGKCADNIIFKENKNTLGKEMQLLLTNCGSVWADNCEVKRSFVKDMSLKVN
jgi:hypothetical protein